MGHDLISLSSFSQSSVRRQAIPPLTRRATQSVSVRVRVVLRIPHGSAAEFRRAAQRQLSPRPGVGLAEIPTPFLINPYRLWGTFGYAVCEKEFQPLVSMSASNSHPILFPKNAEWPHRPLLRASLVPKGVVASLVTARLLRPAGFVVRTERAFGAAARRLSVLLDALNLPRTRHE
jgi:hypothetical protein